MFSVGDTVRLKPEALADSKFIPAQLVQLGGFPNHFTITRTETVEDIDTGVLIHAISLEECCGKLADAKTRIPLCDSHPTNLFELVQKSGHRPGWTEGVAPALETAIDSPWGRLLQLALFKRENGINTLTLDLKPLLGINPVSISGPWADKAAGIAQDLGIL